MKTAREVMKRSFFHVSPSDTISVLLYEMAERGLGCVPVLDMLGRPLGVATTAEIERCYDVAELIEQLERRALCLDQNTPIDIAAQVVAEHPSCCLLLVDASGVAVGALSPVELLGALLRGDSGGDTSPEQAGNVAWDHADILEVGAAHRAPEGPGVILLSPGIDDSRKRRVWAESSDNMRERLDQMLRQPQDDSGLESMLEGYPRTVRFRCLTVEDEAQREQLADELGNVERESDRAPREHADAESLSRSGVMASCLTPSPSVES